MRNRLILLAVVFVFAVSVFLGCDKITGAFKPVKKDKPAPAPEVRGTVIARVNNIPITLEDLNAEIEAYNNMMTANNQPEAKITTTEQKLAYLKNELVPRVLLYQEALDRGLDQDSEVLNALEKYRRELLVLKLQVQENQKIEVDSKEIEDYYNKYKEQLKDPEERQIREIVVSTEQEAKDAMIQLLQGADFATLASQRSKSASASKGGDLGFIKRGEKDRQFDDVAFSDTLDVGRISNIFRGSAGYYILKLEAKSGGKQKSLSELWDDIKKGLTFIKQQKTLEELISKLSTEAKIEIQESEIK